MWILGYYFMPGVWVKQVGFLLALMFIGRFFFSDKSRESEVYWDSLSVLSFLIIIKLLWGK